MAKAPKGLLGPFLGKIGPVIGSSWNGISYIKSAPDPSAPRVFTPAQIAHQQKFKFTGDFTDIMQPFLEVGFLNQAIRKTAKNAAFSYHFHHAVTGAYPDLGIDYSRVKISTGTLSGLSNLVAELLSPTTMQVSWQQPEGSYQAFDDQVMLAIYCPDLQMAEGFIGGAIRRDGNCSYTFNQKLVGHTLEVYIGLTSLSRKRASNSQYIGRFGSSLDIDQ